MAELSPSTTIALPILDGAGNKKNVIDIVPVRSDIINAPDGEAVLRRFRAEHLGALYECILLREKLPDYLYPYQLTAMPARTLPSTDASGRRLPFVPTSVYGDEPVPRTARHAPNNRTLPVRNHPQGYSIDLSTDVSKALAVDKNLIERLFPASEEVLRRVQPVVTMEPQTEGMYEEGAAINFRREFLRFSPIKDANAVILDVLNDARMETPWSALGRPNDGLSWSPLNQNVAQPVALYAFTDNVRAQAVVVQFKRKAGLGPVFNLMVRNGDYVILPAVVVANYEYRIPEDPTAPRVEADIQREMATFINSRDYAVSPFDTNEIADVRELRRAADVVFRDSLNFGRMVVQVTRYQGVRETQQNAMRVAPQNIVEYVRTLRAWRDNTPGKARLMAEKIPPRASPSMERYGASDRAEAFRERDRDPRLGMWVVYMPRRLGADVCGMLVDAFAKLNTPGYTSAMDQGVAWTDLATYDIQRSWPLLWSTMQDLLTDMQEFSDAPRTPQQLLQMFQSVYAFVIRPERAQSVPGQSLMRLETPPNAPSVYLNMGRRPIAIGWKAGDQFRAQTLNQGDVLIMGSGYHSENVFVDLQVSTESGKRYYLGSNQVAQEAPVAASNSVLESHGFLLRLGYDRFSGTIPGNQKTRPVTFAPNTYTFLSALDDGAGPASRTVPLTSSGSSDDDDNDLMDVSRHMGNALGRGGLGRGGPFRLRPWVAPAGGRRPPSFRPWRGYGRRRGYRRWWGAAPWVRYNALNAWILALLLDQSRRDAIRIAQERRDAEEYWRQIILAMRDVRRRTGQWPADMNTYLPQDVVDRLVASPSV